MHFKADLFLSNLNLFKIIHIRQLTLAEWSVDSLKRGVRPYSHYCYTQIFSSLGSWWCVKTRPVPCPLFWPRELWAQAGGGTDPLPLKLVKMCRVGFDLTFNQPPKEIIRSLSSTETISWNNSWHFWLSQTFEAEWFSNVIRCHYWPHPGPSDSFITLWHS